MLAGIIIPAQTLVVNFGATIMLIAKLSKDMAIAASRLNRLSAQTEMQRTCK